MMKMQGLIFKLKLLGLLINPKWFLMGISSNYFMGNSDSVSALPLNGLVVRKIQHNFIQYSFARSVETNRG